MRIDAAIDALIELREKYGNCIIEDGDAMPITGMHITKYDTPNKYTAVVLEHGYSDDLPEDELVEWTGKENADD